MFTGIYRKILAVMIEGGRSPSRSGSVTGSTVSRETCGLVIWISSLVIIILMTGNTIRRESRIGAVGVALSAILNSMSLGQGEKVMVDRSGCPSEVRGMAARTISREPTGLVVRIGRLVIIVLMARDTFR